MIRKVLLPFITLGIGGLTALQAATVSGFVTRQDSAEPMQYVNVRITETKAGAQTNKKGYYVINIAQPGTYTLVASLVSYLKYTQTITVEKATDKIHVDIALVKSGILLNKMTITGKEYDRKEVNTPDIKVSSTQLTTEDIMNTVSVVEADVFRAIQTQPGVTPISDFSSGLYIRGGSPDQNLILIDDIDVYNPNHFGGIFSTFNTDAVETVELIKGGYPAQYGGRLSSVLDVTNRQGNRNFHEGTARLSLISASATLEGPWRIGSEKGSYMGSFRRTYLDFLEQAFDLPDYYFYDGHWKLNWDINPRDKVSTSMYFGKDFLEFDFGNKLHVDWGNRTLSTQWTHIFAANLFSHFVLAGSQFSSNFVQSSDDHTIMDRMNSIDDITLKNIFSWKPSNAHQVDFGLESKWNRTLLKMNTSYQIDPNTLPNVEVQSISNALFVQDIWDINPLWTFQPGLRLSLYNSLHINLPSCPAANYINLEPRLSLRRKLDLNESVYINYGRYYQYLTLMSMGISTPFDMWFPLDGSLDPGQSDHYIFGYKRQFSDVLGLDTELYVKTYHHLLEMNPAVDFTWNNQTGQLKDTFNVGKGYTYGLELLLRNEWRSVEGFIGYTYGQTRRKMDATNTNPDTMEPQYYYPRYDKTHQLNLVETYNLSENLAWQLWGGDLKIGTNYTYATGQPVEKPEGVFFDGEQFQILYSYADRVRLPAYSRLDISLKTEWTKSWGSIEPYLEIINVLNHDNVGGRSYFIEMDDDGNAVLKHGDNTQFPLVPFIGVNVKW